MKLLYLAPLDSIHSRRWIGYFASRGHEVHVVDMGDQPHEPIPKTIHHHIAVPAKTRNPAREYLRRYRPARERLRQLVHDVGPDVAHAHWLDVHAYMLLATGFHPIVATAWGSDILIYPRRSLVSRIVVHRIMRHGDVFTCDAEHMRAAMVRRGAKPDHVKVVYFGTDVGVFHPGRRDEGLAGQLGFPAGSRLVISLRALKPVYNIETFVRASALIHRDVPEARFVVVGDGPERQALETLAREMGVAEAVRFTGRLSDEDLQRYTASADVYVSTSLSDAGLAASTAEAMACAVPVVITRFGNNGDWVKEDETGALFELRDHQELARKVVAFLRDPDRARRIGAAGRKVIEERNNWHREMEKVEQLYRGLAGGPAEASR